MIYQLCLGVKRNVKNEPLYQKIIREILNDIKSEKYKVGDKIPSEKELSQKYGVSRITSKNALDKLSDMGFINRMPGKGTFVTSKNPQKINDFQSYSAEHSPQMIGVILDGFGACFGHKIILGIENQCKKNQVSLALRCSYGSKDAENQAIDEMLALGVSGIIIMCVHQENFSSKVLKLVVEGFPIVVIDRRLKGIPVSFVGTNNERAAKDLTKHLIEEGFRNICFASPDSLDTSTISERLNGFNECCQEHGIVPAEAITNLRATLPESRSDDNLRADVQLVSTYIDNHPHTNAFFAVEFDIAKIIQKTLRGLGLEKNCAVVCFDGIEDVLGTAEFTHIRQREEEIGATAVSCLIKKINGDHNLETILIQHDMVIATQEL